MLLRDHYESRTGIAYPGSGLNPRSRLSSYPSDSLSEASHMYMQNGGKYQTLCMYHMNEAWKKLKGGWVGFWKGLSLHQQDRAPTSLMFGALLEQ